MTTDSVRHLLRRCGLVEQRVRRLVADRRAVDPNPDDGFRGLYVSDELVDRLVGGAAVDAVAVDEDATREVEGWADAAEAEGSPLRLRALARSAGLSDVDVELLLVALLPDLDSRFERIYGYLNDDVTRRRASAGLALTLVGESPSSAIARGRLEPSRPLLRHRLVEPEDPERPFLTRGLRVPDRVVAHLLGDDAADVTVTGLITMATPYATPLAERLASAIERGVRTVYLREPSPGLGSAVAAAALQGTGRPAVNLDLTRLSTGADVPTQLAAAIREAILTGGGVVAGPVEALLERGPDSVRALTGPEIPVILFGSPSWNPQWADDLPLVLDIPPMSGEDRRLLWARELAGHPSDTLDPVALSAQLSLGPAQVRRAVHAAEASARVNDRAVTAGDLRRGVRAQNAPGLERLARRVEPDVSWDDLVVPDGVLRSLRDVADRARNRGTVLTDWRMRRGGGRGRGVTALFAGDSGTGKTMSAEVIAADLQLDLYTVNLATVVDKYIGETEKNLERIFVEAAGVNALLFFDEADAIFGKRSDVRDAHDRYANIESAYLLQRLETFDGLAVLATNLRTNIDDAFIRRLDAIIDFPAPEASLRRTLWERCLAPPLPVTDDIDLDFLAASFELAGGHIRSASTSAAYLAAAAGRAVAMRDAIAAVEQEYRKLGRLVLEREFGRFLTVA